MENCLVTKLKGTVNNDSLPILNAIRIKANAGTYTAGSIALMFNKKSSIDGLNGAELYSGGVSVGTTFPFYVDIANEVSPQNEGGNYVIRNKYNLTHFNSTKGNGLLEYELDEFKELPSITAFTSKNDIVKGDLSSFKNCPLTSFTLNKVSADVYGDFSELPSTITVLDLSSLNKAYNTSELSHLVNVVTLAVGTNDLLTGPITDFGNMKSITTLNVASTCLAGDIVDFVAIQRGGSNPRTTCDRISMSWAGGVGRGLKFNGTEISASASTYIHWDAQKLYLNQGGTDVAEVSF